MKASGGKTIYGAALGILMLETRFPRIYGDMGNAATWPFPVLYKVVPQASPDRVVRQGAHGLLPDFLSAAEDLVRMGADGITTNCGFLSLFQDAIAAQVKVPVATSSLMQAPLIQRLLPSDRKVGILTISAESLTPEHLTAAGVDPDTPVAGTLPGCEFNRVILEDEAELNVELARRDNIEAAQRLVNQHPDVGAILMECTNMSPYAADIQQISGRPVFSIYSFMLWFQAGLMPRSFAP
ncbi:MAG: aspartate/glutamate racemase family protein [Pseudomonadota bacterium]